MENETPTNKKRFFFTKTKTAAAAARTGVWENFWAPRHKSGGLSLTATLSTLGWISALLCPKRFSLRLPYQAFAFPSAFFSRSTIDVDRSTNNHQIRHSPLPFQQHLDFPSSLPSKSSVRSCKVHATCTFRCFCF